MSGFAYDVPEPLSKYPGTIASLLLPLLSKERSERISSGLAQRRRDVLCVFENTHHSHNVSAVLRTIDAMGFVETIFAYTNSSMRFRQRDSVERGSSQWLISRRSNSIVETGEALRRAGYRLLLVSLPSFATTATSYRQDLPQFTVDAVGTPAFHEFLLGKPIALVFGSELNGVSPDWLGCADGYLSIRMSGFVESLNMSVCAGIILHALRARGAEQMLQFEQSLLLDYWIARSTTNASRTLLSLRPDLSDYLNFVRSGSFFDPFPQAHLDHL